MSAFEWPVRVYWEDTDAGGVVYHARYLQFLERARTEWLRSCGYEQGHLSESIDMVFAVRNMNLDFLRPAKLDDLLTVQNAGVPVSPSGMNCGVARNFC